MVGSGSTPVADAARRGGNPNGRPGPAPDVDHPIRVGEVRQEGHLPRHRAAPDKEVEHVDSAMEARLVLVSVLVALVRRGGRRHVRVIGRSSHVPFLARAFGSVRISTNAG